MLKKIQNLHRTTFKAKLLLSYILLITIPLTISSILIFNQFLVTFTENSSTMIEQRLNQEVNNINQTLNTIEKVGYQLASNTSLTTFLNNKYDPFSIESYNSMTNIILPLFNWLKNTNPNINRINVLTFNDSISEIDIFVNANRFESELWFKEMRKKTGLGFSFWENYHPQRLYRGVNIANAPTTSVYSLLCSVNPVYKTSATYLELEINPKSLFTSLNISPVGKSGFLAVLNNKGDIIAGKDDPLLISLLENKNFLSRLDQPNGEYFSTLTGSNYNIYFDKIERLDAHIISIVPTTEITELFFKYKKNYIVTMVITFLFLLLLAYYLGNIFTKKITKITNAFYKFQQGNFNTEISVTGSDELDKLCLDFNTMAANTYELINKVYKAEIAQKQAELSALQAQINPHFIYNTLESLRMTAELHDEEEISDGLAALGNLIRQNNHTEKHLINIESELENISDYIKIQNLIRNNKINVDYHIEEYIKQVPILTLVLQPIVENCILHGFDDKQGILQINVHGVKIENSVYLSIQDNGKGISKTNLNRLKTLLKNRAENTSRISKHSGIGLINVHRRITLYFGNRYGLSIDSTVNQGTTVTIKIPKEVQ